MKKLSILIYITAYLSCIQTNAQGLFNTVDSIDINNINALISVHGNLFWDKEANTAHCRFPANAPTNINASAALWIAAYDDVNILHISAHNYQTSACDYWPGPLDASGSLNYSISQNWAKIWKVKRTDIQIQQFLTEHSISNTPSAILTWPAKGNIYAEGNSDVPLTISGDMAPFVDLNNNGIYEPLSGEYPDVPGDETLWWIYSDNGPTHTQTNGIPLGVEIQAMAYGYKRGTLIDNVIYFNYKIVNKSPNNYHNLQIGAWDDPDLGYAFDDYVGFDSGHRMGIVYNGNDDDGAYTGHPPNSFGTSIPIAGMTVISFPGDLDGDYIPAGSFAYYNNDRSRIGDPEQDTQYNNYLHAKARDGINLKGGECSWLLLQHTCNRQ